MKPNVTYKEIWKIAEDPSLTWKVKQSKLEGCIRRIVREMKNKPIKTLKQQHDYEYRLIEVNRAMATAVEIEFQRE